MEGLLARVGRYHSFLHPNADMARYRTPQSLRLVVGGFY